MKEHKMKSFLSKKILGLAAILTMSQSAMAVALEAFTDTDSIVAGTRFPVYVSAKGEGDSFDLEGAADQSYTLNADHDVHIYRSKNSNEPTLRSYLGKVNPSGVDTLWLEYPLEYLNTSTERFQIGIGSTVHTLSAFLPQISFAKVKTTDKDGIPLTWEPVNHDPDTHEDGSPYFQQTNTEVALALIAISPITMDICKECDFDIVLGFSTSAGVTAEDAKLVNGITTILLRSEKDFETETASISVCVMRNSSIQATYGNMRFLNKPSALPQVSPYKAESMPATYTVMDLQGKILRKGITHNADINMSTFAPGSYIVRIGSNYRRINVR